METSASSEARSAPLPYPTAFIALFAILCYFMLLRVKGWSDELSARLIFHMALALSLAPLLLVKVIVARYQKVARGLLMALGIGTFAVAFTLVVLNLSIHFLRAASTEKVPVWTSVTVVVLILISLVVTSFALATRSKPISDTGTRSLNTPANQKSSNRTEVLNLALARIEPQTDHAKTLRFLLPRGRQIAVRPGQFLTFEWIVDGKLATRSYSICSSPTQAGYIEITPKRVENGYVSQFLNDRANVGLTVKTRGPYGQFCFDESKHKRIVLIAGGSGITPMMAMLRYIDDQCIPVDITLIYCVRAQQEVFFKNEFAALQGRLSKLRYVLVLSRPSPDWTGWKGRLRREILEREVEKPLESTFFPVRAAGLHGAWPRLAQRHGSGSGANPAREFRRRRSGRKNFCPEYRPIDGELRSFCGNLQHFARRNRIGELGNERCLDPLGLPSGDLRYLRHQTAQRKRAHGTRRSS
jgi:ferredoxin-NADP reductase